MKFVSIEELITDAEIYYNPNMSSDTQEGKLLENDKVENPFYINNNKADLKTMPFVIRGVKLWGIDSSGTSARRKDFVWNEVSKLIDFSMIEKSIKEVSLNELLDEFPKILKGELTGRILVNPNK